MGGVVAGRAGADYVGRLPVWAGPTPAPDPRDPPQQSWGQGLAPTGVVGEVCRWEYLLIPVRTTENSRMPPLCSCHPAQGPQTSSRAPREEADSSHTP